MILSQRQRAQFLFFFGFCQGSAHARDRRAAPSVTRVVYRCQSGEVFKTFQVTFKAECLRYYPYADWKLQRREYESQYFALISISLCWKWCEDDKRQIYKHC